ncbi:hypothetical protein [Sulfurovum sp. TSL1]|uniref:hypothetical protein n=1 Tax=Sulfurovum sp. TSL1 TaxID=2826994 RepID=UPI001CC338F5|nr:hypothetical protein [Sulfurovum sp. TSL1]GIT97756.1 hypothetical protein TSL1_05770 [Sulfurovum sp. TSL1]
MKNIFNIIFSGVHLFASIILIVLSLVIMEWSVYEVISSTEDQAGFIPLMLRSVSAIIISAAILDVAQYMMEEEVIKDKELRYPTDFTDHGIINFDCGSWYLSKTKRVKDTT